MAHRNTLLKCTQRDMDIFFYSWLFPPLLPTYRVSYVARINSGIPPIDSEQRKLLKFRGKAKTVMELTSNLIKKKLKDC
jgi:hypothetical protein